MAQTTMTFRTDTDVKNDFSKFCTDVGMNATVALNMFMRTTIARQELPFRVRAASAPPARIDLDLMSKDEIVTLLDERAESESKTRPLKDVLADLHRKYRL